MRRRAMQAITSGPLREVFMHGEFPLSVAVLGGTYSQGHKTFHSPRSWNPEPIQ